MNYVLFKVSKDGVEEYIGRKADNSLGLTDQRACALPFETARLAYEFGGEHRLLDMKVGYR